MQKRIGLTHLTHPDWIPIAGRVIGQLGDPTTIGGHDENLVIDSEPGKSQPIAVQRPSWEVFVLRRSGQITYVAAVHIHHKDVHVAVSVAGKGDLTSVRRPSRVGHNLAVSREDPLRI